MRESSSVAAQQRHANADHIVTTAEGDSSAQGQTPSLDQKKPIADQGSATTKVARQESPLPLLILLTGLGVAGVLYWLKR
jgi:hypothetical protein